MNIRSISLVLTACAVGLAPVTAEQTQDLESTVRSEADKAASFFNVSPKLVFPHFGGYSSQRDEGVSVNLTRVQHDLEELSQSERIYRLRWILGHEYWHQVQFEKYSDEFPSDQPEVSRLFECQADIMGALYSGQSFTFSGLLESDIQSYSQTLMAISGLATNLAEDETLLPPGSHPDADQRGMAIYYGMMRAHADRLANSKVQQDIDFQSNLRGAIEIKDTERVEDWSYRLCQKIVHITSAATEALALIDETPPWPKENFSGWFRLKYRNTSDRSIRARISVYLAVVEMNGVPSIPWPLQSKEFEFELRVGAEQSLMGSFGIDPIPGTRVSVIYPRSKYAYYTLFSAEFLDQQDTPAPLVSLKIIDDDKYLRPSAKLLYSLLPDLAFEARDKFSHFISGVCDNYGDEKRCPVNFVFPGSSNSTLVLEKSGAAHVDSDLYEGNSQSDAIRVLQAFADDLRAVYPGVKIPKIDPAKRITSFDVDLSAHAALKVYFFEPRKTSEKYLVTTEVYSTW
jgi:hypothetical protein